METFALVVLLASAPPCWPVPTWQSPGCGMPSVITEGLTKSEREEIAAWRERDPVKKLKDDAIAAKTLTAEDFEKVDGEIAAVLEDAAQFALASALEDESTALRHVYAD